jgi:hypothetical protein
MTFRLASAALEPKPNRQSPDYEQLVYEDSSDSCKLSGDYNLVRFRVALNIVEMLSEPKVTKSSMFMRIDSQLIRTSLAWERTSPSRQG